MQARYQENVFIGIWVVDVAALNLDFCGIVYQ